MTYNNHMFYGDNYEEFLEDLNANNLLKDTFDEIENMGMIYSISADYLEEHIIIIEFAVNTEYSAFMTDNNGTVNFIAYCINEECQKYGYKKIEGNWYMYIPERPE